MNRYLRLVLVVVGILLLLSLWPACQVYDEMEKAQSDDPTVWEDDIRALEASTAGPVGSVIFTGSSSIRLWRSLADDMAPLPVIRRGFGGAKMGDAVHYASRLVAAEAPAAIVVFVGTNDIVPGKVKPSSELLQDYRKLVSNIWQVHSSVPIYYIAITPSPSRWSVWEHAQSTNAMIAEYIASESGLHYIDTGPLLLHNGEPNPDNYVFDGLHLNVNGYAVWTNVIRKRLLADLQRHVTP